VELRLLGPFEIVTGDGRQHRAQPGERALLALLALSTGTVVPSTVLIDALWDPDELPDDPTNALQVRVSKLRRTLQRIGTPNPVHRLGSGYRLDLDPADVDVHRFTGLVQTARHSGDPHQAVDRYARALALWRGDPLIDFAGSGWVTVETGRLVELRLAAVAECADRMLTLGRYDEAVAVLEPVVVADPTRERQAGLLMTALFNAGRQAEALGVFTRTRRALAEDLGLDPSRELRSVMEQILRQGPADGRAPSDTPTPGRVGPPGRATGNLPLRSTSFVGRDHELARTGELLGRSRLVTLAGPGGAGKTTLAVEAARLAAPTVRDGVWLVRFAAVTEREMLVPTVADALGLSMEGGTAVHRPRDVLLSRLGGLDLLLVLDNCEHLIEPVASLCEAILQRCPGVRMLATSREALAVAGEVQLPVAPLPVPDVGTPPDRVSTFAAARLFLDRAAAVTAGGVDDDDGLAAVAVICRRLDGIPLALELAAARLSSLTPAELAERVGDRFAVLTSGSRTAEARQRTLRDTVDWSHRLLTDDEKVVFRRLAVFRGGWTLGAAEVVVSGAGLRTAAVLDLLDRLVRQSLVVAEVGHDGHTRYRMLETLRQYADDELDRAGERHPVAAAHADHFLDLGERAETGLRGRSQERWHRTLRTEHPNLRAALSWFTDTGPADAALRLAGSLGLYWHMGRHLEGRAMLRRVLALPGGSPTARARALQAVSLVERPRACIVHPSRQCAAAARESLEVFEAAGDRPRTAFSRLLLAVEGVGSDATDDAAAQLERADLEFADLGDDWGRAVVAFVRMETRFKRGDEASARRAAVDATAQFRALGDGWGLSAVLYHHGFGVAQFGAHGDAVPLLEEAIEVATRAGVHNTVQWATADLGLALLALGRVQEASACFDRAGTVSEQVGDHAGRVLAVYGDALLAARAGDHRRARPLFERAVAAFDRLGVSLPTCMALAGLASSDLHLGDRGAAREHFERLVRLAAAAGEIGLLAGGLEGAAAATADGDPAAAAEMLGRAAGLRTRFDRPPTPLDRTMSDSASRTARAALGGAAYDAAVRRGAAIGLGPVS